MEGNREGMEARGKSCYLICSCIELRKVCQVPPRPFTCLSGKKSVCRDDGIGFNLQIPYNIIVYFVSRIHNRGM